MSLPVLSAATVKLWIADRDPTFSEASKIERGNFWLNSSSNKFFNCITEVPGNLQWNTYTNSSGIQDFAPTVIGSAVSGAGTYVVQTGKYEKIGNQVFIRVNLQWSAHTGSGNMSISGLPFNPVANLIQVSSISTQNIPLPALKTGVLAKTNNNNLDIVATITNAVEAGVALPSAGILRLNMNYTI